VRKDLCKGRSAAYQGTARRLCIHHRGGGVRRGERILKEGGHGKWIWVILEGAVEITRETPDGPLVVARLGEGSFIGTFAALRFKEHARTANVTPSPPSGWGCWIRNASARSTPPSPRI